MINGNKPKTVMMVAYLSGDQNQHKRTYLYALDIALRERGYRLLLVDQAGHDIEGSFFTRKIDLESDKSKRIKRRLHKCLSNNRSLRDAVATEAGFGSISFEEAAEKLFSVVAAIIAIFEEEDISFALLWHQFNGTSMLLADFLRNSGIPFQYVHLGPLPGSIIFEADGQMAESWVVREYRRFRRLPLTAADMDIASYYLDYVREIFLDRKKQPETGPLREMLVSKVKRSQPVLFFAGQNDYRTGMIPRFLPKARWHSPFYNDTEDAFKHLCVLAKKKDWFIIFKPHPNLQKERNQEAYSSDKNFCIVHEANLFECILLANVTVTIVSSSAYQALIHKRPVILLGRMPLTGKRCVYEVFARCLTGHTVERALQRGFTEKQQKFWHRHVAQVLKHYVFSFDDKIESIIGRGVQEAAENLVSFYRTF